MNSFICLWSPLTIEKMSWPRNLSSVTIGVVVFVVFALSLVSAQNDPHLSPPDDLSSMKDFEELLQAVQLMFETTVGDETGQRSISDEEDDAENNTMMDGAEENDVEIDEKDVGDDAAVDDDGGNDVAAIPNGCSCSRYGCTCCKRIRMRRFKFNKRCCLSLHYLRRHYGILVKLTIAGRVIFRKEVSARNPPPICTRIPWVGRHVSFCIQLSNLSIRRHKVSGCSTFLFRVFWWVPLKVSLGCFRFNYLDAVKQVGEVEFPFLEGPQVALEGPEPIYLDEIWMNNIKPVDDKRN